MKKTYVIFALVIAVLGLVLAYLAYNQQPMDIRDMKPASQITAADLFSQFEADEEAANAKYLGKVILVSGVISKIENSPAGATNILLQSNDDFFGVACKLKAMDKAGTDLPKAGELVSVKGICTGFLTDVVLIDCYVE